MQKKPYRTLLVALGLLAGNLIFFLTIWMASKYDKVTLDQFIYQLKSSAAGANRSLRNSALVRVGGFGVGAAALEFVHYLCCTWSRSRYSRFIVRRATALVLAMVVLAASLFTVKLNLVQYVSAVASPSSFYADHYADPDQVTLTFPEEPRNLIYIFLESTEVTFTEPEAGGPIYENFMPELTRLAQENINFSHDDDVGGAMSFSGTTWTAAAMVTQTSGVNVLVPLHAEYYGGENGYMPGITSIGEILEAQGYNQTLLVGSDAQFGGRDAYFTEHGNYNIVDLNTLKQRGWLRQDYRKWWGFEDTKLFAAAKLELTALAAQGKPFNFTLLTCDTHFPDGYRCKSCQNEYPERYPTVMRCASRQVAEFVSWVQQQPFYDNTTIVISGDHLTMDPDFMEGLDENYIRTVYNCILNPAVEPVQEKNRLFGTFDLFPTTLAAMGVEIQGERLGLGTNLFSAKPTYAEVYGFETLDWELQKTSDFYNQTFLGLGGDQ